MAKRNPTSKLPGMEDEVPDVLDRAVADYLKNMRSKNTFSAKEKASKDQVIELMKEHEIDVLEIDDGAKYLRLVEDNKLKTEKAKKTAEDD
jgi:hypothetical protein